MRIVFLLIDPDSGLLVQYEHPTLQNTMTWAGLDCHEPEKLVSHREVWIMAGFLQITNSTKFKNL